MINLSAIQRIPVPAIRFAAIAVLFVAGIAACSNRTPPPKDPTPHPVTGKVVGPAGPLKSGTVLLRTSDPFFTAKGEIKADGTFTLKTITKDPPSEVDGVAEGGYMVRVMTSASAPALKLKSDSVRINKGPNELTIEIAE